MEQSQARPSRKSAKYTVGAAVIVVTLALFVVWAMARPGATSFYYSPSEVVAASALGPDYRVHAKVVPGSIKRNGLESRFDLSDGKTTVTVATDVPLPDTLKDNSEVIARGALHGEVFKAVEVVAKCPSKFKAKA